MRYPAVALKQPKIVCISDNGSQALESMPKPSREEAEISALFQRLPKMLASLESLSEN